MNGLTLQLASRWLRRGLVAVFALAVLSLSSMARADPPSPSADPTGVGSVPVEYEFTYRRNLDFEFTTEAGDVGSGVTSDPPSYGGEVAFVIPEPPSVVLLTFGLAGVVGYYYYRRPTRSL